MSGEAFGNLLKWQFANGTENWQDRVQGNIGMVKPHLPNGGKARILLNPFQSEESMNCIKKATSFYQQEIEDLADCVLTNHEAFFEHWSIQSIKKWNKEVRELKSRILID